MLPDDWHLTQDVDDFLAQAGDFLCSRPALHNTPLTDIEKLRIRGAAEDDAEAAVFGRLESGGEIRAIFYLTPRGRLGLTPSLSSRPTPSLLTWRPWATRPPTSSRTTTLPVLSPSHGSGTQAQHRFLSGGRICTVSARSPHRSRPRRARGASRARRTVNKSCAGAVSSVSTSGSSPPST